jgi:sialate O-acetylesterase
MQWTVSQAANPEQEIAAAKFPQIRMFNIERETAETPQTDCKGKWLEANPANAGTFSAVGYFFGRSLHQDLKVPVGLINTSWGGTRVEAWTSMDALKERPCAKDMLAGWDEQARKYDPKQAKDQFDKKAAAYKEMRVKFDAENAKLPADKKKNPPRGPEMQAPPRSDRHHPAAIYNRMIASIIPYGIQGAIWYQGESNQRRAVQYQELLPTMILDWRKRWGEDFSFYIVQLAEFGNGKAGSEPGAPDAWAELQEAQLLTAQTLSHCGLVVANDIGEEKDIHPKNKQEVGRRLALWALAKDYGKKEVVFSGPVFKKSKVEGGKVRLSFNFASGLKTRDGKEPQGFIICGTDQKWLPAKAKIEGSDVAVWNDAVKQPAAVRYAWASWSKDDNLVNAAGLPASCFRTDDFLPSTLGVTSPFNENPPAAAPPVEVVAKATPAKPAPAKPEPAKAKGNVPPSKPATAVTKAGAPPPAKPEPAKKADAAPAKPAEAKGKPAAGAAKSEPVKKPDAAKGDAPDPERAKAKAERKRRKQEELEKRKAELEKPGEKKGTK